MTRLALAVFLFVSPSLAGAADLRLSHAPALLYCMAVQLATIPDEPPPELPPELPQEQEATEEDQAAEGNGHQTAPNEAKDVAPPAAAQEPVADDPKAEVIDDSDQYATPREVVYKVLAYLQPKANEVFIDPGCGDGRVLIAAAKHYGCRAIGIEIDPNRVALAKQRAEEAGVADRVTILQGDFKTMDWPRADVGYVYLFPSELQAIRNKLLSLDRFVSFAHKVPSLSMWNRNNEFYAWHYSKAFSWWDGNAYQGKVCNKQNCRMCLSIMGDIAEQRSHRRQPQAVQSTSQVVVYTSPNCRPCAVLKQRLRAAGIPFTEMRGAPGRSVPYASINGRVYTGASIYRAVGLN